MPTTSILFGRILIALGVIGYGYGFIDGNPSITALIPAAFGIVLLSLGYVARMKEGARKHLMHVAVLVGLLGFAIPLVRLISAFSAGKPFGFASLMLSAMALTCFAFVVLCIMSFINARANR